ncbi:hypothetical protein CRUP_018184, partial [Coryphaenoides rupestris]
PPRPHPGSGTGTPAAPFTLPGTPTLHGGTQLPEEFSTRSWLSQTCQVCQKNMMFGVKFTKIRRTESVPSDINNPVDRPAEAPQFGTLPKALTKKVDLEVAISALTTQLPLPGSQGVTAHCRRPHPREYLRSRYRNRVVCVTSFSHGLGLTA